MHTCTVGFFVLYIRRQSKGRNTDVKKMPQNQLEYTTFKQGCGSGSVSGLDPDPYSESGSGSRRAKMIHISRNFFEKFMFRSVGWPLLRAEGFFCNSDFLYGGLGIGKL